MVSLLSHHLHFTSYSFSYYRKYKANFCFDLFLIGILVCFFLIALGKACAHRKKFADPLDYEDGMPEVKKEPLPIVNVAAPEARRDWEWDQKVDDSKKDNYENQNKSTTRLVDEPIGGERVLSISSKSNVGEYGMPQVPARSHRDVGAQNARNINSSNNNKSRHLTSTTTASNTTSAHPLSHHQTIGSSSDQASQRSSSYSRSRSSSVDSYDEFSPPSPRSPNNDPPSPRSPNSYNNSSTQQPPRSILSNGGVQITQPRPLFINPVSSPTKSNLNGLGSPNNKLPSPGSKAGSPTFMSHLQNTKPLDYSSIPPSPTTPFSSNSAAPELLPHLRFAPIALDAPPKKNKRFSAISTPLSNRFSLASSNWSFQAPPTPTLPPGPIEQSIMNEQQARQFQQEQYDQQDFNSRAEGNGGELPYHLGPSDSTLDYPPKSPHSNLASPKALAYVERPRTDSIGGFSSVTNGTGGGRKSKRDVVSGVYSGYTPSNFAPSIKSPKFAGKK